MNTNTPITAPPVSPPSHGQLLLTWQGRTIPHQERSDRWYAIGGIIVLVATAYAIITGLWSLAIVVVLCGAMYFLQRGHVPPFVQIALHDEGIVFNDAFHPWNALKGYWIIQTPQYTEVHIAQKNSRKQLVIQIGDLQPEIVRRAFGDRLPEDLNRRESILDTFTRICKL